MTLITLLNALVIAHVGMIWYQSKKLHMMCSTVQCTVLLCQNVSIDRPSARRIFTDFRTFTQTFQQSVGGTGAEKQDVF